MVSEWVEVGGEWLLDTGHCMRLVVHTSAPQRMLGADVWSWSAESGVALIEAARFAGEAPVSLDAAKRAAERWLRRHARGLLEAVGGCECSGEAE